MSKRIRADHEWYELRGAHVRTARKVHDCDMGNCLNWRSKIQVGDTYAWMSHGLNVCNQHFLMEDVVNGPVHPDSASDGPRDEP